MAKVRVKRGVGVSITAASKLSNKVQIHILVTRASGDVEKYKLAEGPDLIWAIAARRRLMACRLPARVATKMKVA